MFRASSSAYRVQRRREGERTRFARNVALACAIVGAYALGAMRSRGDSGGRVKVGAGAGVSEGRPSLSSGVAQMWPIIVPLSWTPRAFEVRQAIAEEEIETILRLARARVARSTVIDSVTGETKVDPIRTSKQTFLSRDDAVIRRMFERLSAVTLLPWYHNEDLQVLEYGVGEKYEAHEDVGEEGSKSGDQLAHSGGKRVATLLLYLEEPEEGGETAFPDSKWIDSARAKGEKWSKCADRHVAMKPKRGHGLLFWSVNPNGKIDHRAMHTGCPVVRGTKWTATIWVHAEPYNWKPPPEPVAPPECADKHDRCRAWSNTGECDKNPSFMLSECKWSCRVPGCDHE